MIGGYFSNKSVTFRSLFFSTGLWNLVSGKNKDFSSVSSRVSLLSSGTTWSMLTRLWILTKQVPAGSPQDSPHFLQTFLQPASLTWAWQQLYLGEQPDVDNDGDAPQHVHLLEHPSLPSHQSCLQQAHFLWHPAFPSRLLQQLYRGFLNVPQRKFEYQLLLSRPSCSRTWCSVGW